MQILKEFRDFAVRGNVVDMSVGIIIGAAFGGIVTSLVNDVIMPPLGWLAGRMDFSSLAIRLQPAVVDATGKVTTPEVAIRYGKFVNTAINFLIVAFAVFLLVKAINAARRRFDKEQQAAPQPTPPTKDQELLAEIRDLLRDRK